MCYVLHKRERRRGSTWSTCCWACFFLTTLAWNNTGLCISTGPALPGLIATEPAQIVPTPPSRTSTMSAPWIQAEVAEWQSILDHLTFQYLSHILKKTTDNSRVCATVIRASSSVSWPSLLSTASVSFSPRIAFLTTMSVIPTVGGILV